MKKVLKKMLVVSLWFLFFLLSLFSTTCRSTQYLNDLDGIVKDKRVVIVRHKDEKTGKSCMGTGVLIPEGILTTYHIVDSPGEITVKFSDDSSTKAILVKKSWIKDLALLKVDKDLKEFEISKLGEIEGDSVYSIGHPRYPELGQRKWQKVKGTIILRNTYLPTGDILFIMPHGNGASGSPIWDEKDEIAGILKGGLGDSFSIGTNAEAIKEFIED